MLKQAKNILIRTKEFIAHNPDFVTNSDISNELNSDILIITATPQEFESIKQEIGELKELEIDSKDSTIYYQARIKGLKESLKVILTYPNGMGIESAINTTAKAISHFSPNLVLMCGICAGNKNVTQIGDLIIAEKTINYGNVVEIKKKSGATNKKFMQSADSINKTLMARLTQFSKSVCFETISKSAFKEFDLKREPKCQLGLLVTGSTLIRSDEKMKEINDSYHGIKGLDMESHGVYFASSNSNKEKNPLYFSMKAVSDYGDNRNHKLSSKKRTELALRISSKSVMAYIQKHFKK